jgi:acetyl-CoA C-acetyltransferase
MARAFAEAFAEAHLQPEDVHAFDLYSCFPSAVELACDTLGISLDDPRPLTATGGLPYAGGPGNDYGTHGIAALAARLRAEPGSIGMATGIGWYFSKHSAGLYGTLPRMELPGTGPPPPAAAEESVATADTPSGRGRIEAYTVVHDRDGAPELGIVIGRLDDERRFLAWLDADAGALAEFETREGVGRTGRVRPDGDVNRFTVD